MRPAPARAILAAAATALALLAVPAASAHAYLASADPGPDAHVAQAPPELRLRFTEELEHEFTHASVLDLDGTRVDQGTQEFPPGEPTVLVVPLKPLRDGIYTVDWATLSVDTHTAQGSYVFAVGNASLEGAPAATAAHQHPEGASAWLEPTGHALAFAGVVLGVGLPLFALAIDRDALADPARGRRLLQCAAAAALVGAAGGALGLLAFAQRVSLPAAGTGTGRWLAARAAALLLAAATFAGKGKPRLRAGAGLALAAAALLATSLSSHAAAAATGRAPALAADLAHLAAASVWAGGIAALLLALPGAGVGRAASLVRRFSPWAMGSVALLVATGAYASFLHLSAWADLVRTGYGQAILAKVALAAILVGLGALNRQGIGPRLDRGEDRTRALRRSVRAEAVLMATVLAVTGLLTTLAPPDTAATPAPTGPTPAFSQILKSGHLVVTITPQPVTVGIQRFTVELHPLAAPVPNGTTVYLKFQAPGQGEPEDIVPTNHTAAETWTLRGGYLTSRGTWTVHVVVQNLKEYATPSFQVQVT
jgi:copper transport protein